LLSAPPYAVSCAVAAELGHTTAEAVRDCRTLSFFGALHRKPAGSICGQVFASTWEDRASKSASPWVKHVSRLLELYGLDCEQVMDKSAWKRVVKAAVAKVSGERWRNTCVHTSDCRRIMRFDRPLTLSLTRYSRRPPVSSLRCDAERRD